MAETCSSVCERYRAVRRFGHRLCEPLTPEDCAIQSMPDVSPTRWHLAHTTWFFETFVLSRSSSDYRPFHPAYEVLFNSYYNTVGEQFPRSRRGLLSRPTVSEVFDYRAHVDARMEDFLENGDPADVAELTPVVEVGLHHEQQHQELMLTDIKHVLSCNPLCPKYMERPEDMKGRSSPQRQAPPLSWSHFGEGLYQIGHTGEEFVFDNETPRHRVFVETFELATRLATNGEYLAFVEDGGYRRPELWLSAGWQEVCENAWEAPLYWTKRGGGWEQFTLGGLSPVDPAAPICHASYYEADAFARWSGGRLATEAEWEVAAEDVPLEGNFVEDGILHPAPASATLPGDHLTQMYGDVWEWTSSQYVPYPGYRPLDGALGEYNGKFMCNQFVLRGGSCATQRSHMRRTYRNFFPPEARWQFSGIRLAR